MIDKAAIEQQLAGEGEAGAGAAARGAAAFSI